MKPYFDPPERSPSIQPRRRSEQVAPFGSHANGLAAHSSDIDVVVLGLVEPPPNAGNGGACDDIHLKMGRQIQTALRLE
jgi:predicted nucleotidyltransferase